MSVLLFTVSGLRTTLTVLLVVPVSEFKFCSSLFNDKEDEDW